MKLAILLCGILLSNIAIAAKHSGQVIGYFPYHTGQKEILFIRLDSGVSGGCNTTERFAIDSNSPGYKSTQASIMAAFHAKTTINVNYSSTCNVFGNAYDINYICVGNIAC